MIVFLTITTVAVFIASMYNDILVNRLRVTENFPANEPKESISLLKLNSIEEFANKTKMISKTQKGSRFAKRQISTTNKRLQEHINTLMYLSKLEMYYQNSNIINQLPTERLENFLELKASVRRSVLTTIEEISH